MYRKINIYLVLFAVMAFMSLTVGPAIAAPVTQSITFQGKLTNAAGSPLTGTYSVTFRLYDASTGGTTLSSDTHSVTATNGLFTTPVTFDSSFFDGRALWLGIKVGSDAEMTPRQEIRPVPYALGLREGAVGTSLTTCPTGGSSVCPVALNVTIPYASKVGIKVNTSGNYDLGIGVSTLGSNSPVISTESYGYGSPGFNIHTYNDWSEGYLAFTRGDHSNGLRASTAGDDSHGIMASTYGANSHGVDAFASGPGSQGVHAESWNGPGVYGEGKEGGYFTTSTAGTSSTPLAGVHVVTTGASYNSGALVTTIGTSSPGFSASTGGTGSPGVLARTGGDNSQGVLAQTTGDSSHGIDSYTSGQNSKGVVAYTSGYDSDGVQATTHGQYSDGVYAYTTGYGSAAVAARAYGLYSQGVYAYSEQSRALEGDTNNANHEWGVYTEDYIYGGGIRAPDVDVAEYMPVLGALSNGTILIIGPEGKLQMATTANDTRVAGIVSTSPAIALGTRPGGNKGEEIVAISGRVPCKVDASYGAIHPGDLLSTSDTPGHAMKAKSVQIGEIEFYRDGTILGKAMGTLESGTGTIEVLVTLQ